MIILVDTREQAPYVFQGERYKGVTVERGTLQTGDYTMNGYESRIVFERKQLDDFIGSITSGRDRFEREMERAKEIERFYLIIEASPLDISRGLYQSRMNPHAALQTLWSWHCKYGVIPVYAGNRDGGEYHVWSIMRWFLEHMVEAA